MGQAQFFFKIVPISFIIRGQDIRNYHKLHHMNWFKRTLLPNSRWTKFLGFFTSLEGLIQVLEPQYLQPPSYWPFLAKNWIITLASTLSITFGIPFFQIGSSFQVIPVDSCKSGLTWESRDSSVGRALDWRSKGPRFDPGSRHFFFNTCQRHFIDEKVGPGEIRTHDLLFTRQAL